MAQNPRELLQKADKAVSSAGGGFSLFGGRTEKYENAADLYTQAANAFRMQKQTKEAGLAFERAAAIQTKNLSEPDDAANTLVEAFKVYRKTDPADAARVIDVAINHYTSKGNFRRAATQKQNQAETYEEMGDAKRAIDAYELAASWFEGDNAEALANKLYLKVAELTATTIVAPNPPHTKKAGPNYQKAYETFEKVAASSIASNLMKWSVKDYFLKAGICRLGKAVSEEGEISAPLGEMSGAVSQYTAKDPTFSSTRECQLLADLFEAITAGDIDLFSEKLFQYDQMSTLDKWKLTVLGKIKTDFVERPEDYS